MKKNLKPKQNQMKSPAQPQAKNAANANVQTPMNQPKTDYSQNSASNKQMNSKSGLPNERMNNQNSASNEKTNNQNGSSNSKMNNQNNNLKRK